MASRQQLSRIMLSENEERNVLRNKVGASKDIGAGVTFGENKSRDFLADIGNRMINKRAGAGAEKQQTAAGSGLVGLGGLKKSATVTAHQGGLRPQNSIITRSNTVTANVAASQSKPTNLVAAARQAASKPSFFKRPQLPSVSGLNRAKPSSTVTSALAISKATAAAAQSKATTTTTSNNIVLKKKIIQNLNELPTLPLDSNFPGVESAEAQVETVRWAFSNQQIKEVEDIDEEYLNNPLMGSCYNVDISNYLFALEKNYKIKPSYLEGRLVNSRMRSVLVDWLVEVHNQFGFSTETLFMAVNILDRYLMVYKECSRSELQLIGATSLYLAAKYEEVQTPTMCDFSGLCDNAFKTVDVKNMEATILNKLGFDLSPPQPIYFLRRFSRAAASHTKEGFVIEPFVTYALGKYIIELCLIDYTTIHFLPSQIAAASIALAMLVFKDASLEFLWNATMQHYTNYTVQDIRVLLPTFAQVLMKYQEEPGKLQAILNKFSKPRFCKISRNASINPGMWRKRVFDEINLLSSNNNV